MYIQIYVHSDVTTQERYASVNNETLHGYFTFEVSLIDSNCQTDTFFPGDEYTYIDATATAGSHTNLCCFNT
jgi:hypothetical protein